MCYEVFGGPWNKIKVVTAGGTAPAEPLRTAGHRPGAGKGPEQAAIYVGVRVPDLRFQPPGGAAGAAGGVYTGGKSGGYGGHLPPAQLHNHHLLKNISKNCKSVQFCTPKQDRTML